ncbi:MAG: 3-hydroxyacyl-CoA dehydrogenase NAD-binding domain-containing protein [Phycisphaeraceae bacterium]
MQSTLRIHECDDRLVTVFFDQRGKSVNTISPTTLDELEALVIGWEALAPRPAGIIFASAKPGVFITGADLFALKEMDGEQTEAFLQRGQKLFDRIAKLPMPTVAAINGTCLGGGLELALACRYRVAADEGAIQIGLPEIKLGILPAWGGTTRLPRLIGLRPALPLLLAGKALAPRRALKLGVIDEVVRPEALLAAAKRLLRTTPPLHRLPRMERIILKTSLLRRWVLRAAQRQTLEKTHGNYPAADKLIDTVRTGFDEGFDAGLRAERDSLVALAQTDACRNLMRIFFVKQNAKRVLKQALAADSSPVHHAAVIGGGTMGAGIAHALIRAGIPVRLIEVNDEAASAALQRIDAMLKDDLRAKRISPLQMAHAMRLLAPATDWTGLKLADIVIEAVAENMEVKRDVFAKLDRLTRNDTVLATNTSSLSVTALANGTARPGRVVGLHFFNPVRKMPLVEVIRTPQSDDHALATAADLAQRLGKTPVLVRDGPGFLVNRVLFPYLAEAMTLAAGGAPIQRVDEAMKKWGAPMGPFELLDEVGLDIAAAIFTSAVDRIDRPITAPPGLTKAVEKKMLGKKSGAGFYCYGRRKGSKPRVNTKLLALLREGKGDSDVSEEAIPRRLVLPMINEASRVLTEGITNSTETIDLATVLGLGLAPFRGGLVHHAETVGLSEIVRQLDELAAQVDPRFTPTDALRRAAEAGQPMQSLAADGASDAQSSSAGASRKQHA